MGSDDEIRFNVVEILDKKQTLSESVYLPVNVRYREEYKKSLFYVCPENSFYGQKYIEIFREAVDAWNSDDKHHYIQLHECFLPGNEINIQEIGIMEDHVDDFARFLQVNGYSVELKSVYEKMKLPRVGL